MKMSVDNVVTSVFDNHPYISYPLMAIASLAIWTSYSANTSHPAEHRKQPINNNNILSKLLPCVQIMWDYHIFVVDLQKTRKEMFRKIFVVLFN